MTQLTLIIGNKNYSSWSLRPWLAMTQAGLEFAEIRIPLDTPTFKGEIQQYSPTYQVPVLQHGDLTIWDSLAICEYVAEQFAPQLWPQDAEKRAIARAVSAEMHSGFAPLRTHMPMDCRSRWPGEGHLPEVLADVTRVREIWRTCREQYGEGGAFLFGEFSIADAMYAPVISRFVTYGVDLDSVCQTYADAVWQLPAIQQWLSDAAQETEVIEY